MKAPGKKRNCVVGKSCGASCISKWKRCLIEAKRELSKGLTEAARSIHSSQGSVPKSEREKLAEKIRDTKSLIEESKGKIREWENSPGYTPSNPTLTALKGKDGVIARYQAQYDRMPRVTTWEAKNLKSRLSSQIRSMENLEFRLQRESPLLYKVRMENKRIAMREAYLRQLERQLGALPESA